MRTAISLCILLPIFLLGCKDKGMNGSTAEYESMLQFDVGCADTRNGAYNNTGDIHVAATCYVPVPSQGGPGHVLSYCNDLLVEVKWSKVEPFRHVSKPGVVFTDLRWRIGNRLREDVGTTRTFGWTGPINPNTKGFSQDYETLTTAVSFNHSSTDPNDGPFLMLRARWVPTKINPPEIQLQRSAG